MNKPLGFLDVFCIASGAMISSGIFILPGLAFAQAGPAVVVAYFLAGVLALIGVFSVVELATAMPKAGGDYYFVTRSLGPLVGTIAGLLSWIALSLKTAFAVFGLAEVIYLLSDGRIPLFATAVPVIVFFVYLNIKGAGAAAKLEVVLVLCLLALMGFYFFIGAPNIQMSHFHPFISGEGGFNAILSTTGFVFVSFGGLLNIATISEEVRNPRRNIPAGFIAATLVITVLYALMLTVTVGVLPAKELSGSLSPIADTARLLAGTAGYVAITIAAVLAFVTTANAGILSASRYPLALGRDRLLPPFVAKVNAKGAPVVAILLTGAVVLGALLLDIDKLVKAASAVVLSSFILSAVAVLVLRKSNLTNYRPTFRVPLYPWLPLFGIGCFIFLIADMGLESIEISIGLLLLALGMYFFYGRKHSSIEYALLHMLEPLFKKTLTKDALEKELYQNIVHRDDMVHDAFDEILKKAEAIDLPPGATKKELLDIGSRQLEKTLPLTEEEIRNQFIERERQGSCVVTPFVAIPHILIEGKNQFQILLIRSREGIAFEAGTSVKAFFVIVGSRDMRNQHLKALAAIGHIVQHAEFEERWASAKNEIQLKDILLLSERIRM